MGLLAPVLWTAFGLAVFGLVSALLIIVTRKPNEQEFPMNLVKSAERDTKLKITLTEQGGKYQVTISTTREDNTDKMILQHANIQEEAEANEIYDRMKLAYNL